jgi:hypothetical protein
MIRDVYGLGWNIQVLPVLEGNEQGIDDLVDEKDVKTEVMRSRGAGGQVGLSIWVGYDCGIFSN